MADETAKYGWTTLPADQSKDEPATPTPAAVNVVDLQPPDTPLAQHIAKYAKSKLPKATYLHSLRVYSYGRAIAQQCFPTWKLIPGSPLDETWFLTAMLHDIGTSEEFIARTRLSFEFWGGYHALDLLQRSENGAGATAPPAQAESVAEAIIRHQDIQPSGSVTLITRLIHLGTLLDNIGASTELVHRDTIRNVVAAYDREGWAGCFKATVEQEKSLKPYTMVSRIEGFEEKIAEHGKQMED